MLCKKTANSKGCDGLLGAGKTVTENRKGDRCLFWQIEAGIEYQAPAVVKFNFFRTRTAHDSYAVVSNQSVLYAKRHDMTETGLPKDRVPAIRVPAMPKDANEGGSIFGGWIMSYVDIAGSLPAVVRAKGPVVTRAVESFEFKKPVFVGDVISCYADIISEGKSSIKVKVEVYSQSIAKGEIVCNKVTEAVLVYVAIGGDRKPRHLP